MNISDDLLKKYNVPDNNIEETKKYYNMGLNQEILNKIKIHEIADKLSLISNISTDVVCPKCGEKTIISELHQTRASDEAKTEFIRCLNPSCGYYGRKN